MNTFPGLVRRDIFRKIQGGGRKHIQPRICRKVYQSVRRSRIQRNHPQSGRQGAQRGGGATRANQRTTYNHHYLRYMHTARRRTCICDMAKPQTQTPQQRAIGGAESRNTPKKRRITDPKPQNRIAARRNPCATRRDRGAENTARRRQLTHHSLHTIRTPHTDRVRAIGGDDAQNIWRVHGILETIEHRIGRLLLGDTGRTLQTAHRRRLHRTWRARRIHEYARSIHPQRHRRTEGHRRLRHHSSIDTRRTPRKDNSRSPSVGTSARNRGRHRHGVLHHRPVGNVDTIFRRQPPIVARARRRTHGIQARQDARRLIHQGRQAFQQYNHKGTAGRHFIYGVRRHRQSVWRRRQQAKIQLAASAQPLGNHCNQAICRATHHHRKHPRTMAATSRRLAGGADRRPDIGGGEDMTDGSTFLNIVNTFLNIANTLI